MFYFLVFVKQNFWILFLKLMFFFVSCMNTMQSLNKRDNPQDLRVPLIFHTCLAGTLYTEL